MKKLSLLILLALLIPSSLVLAKGDFAYIAVSGQGIQGEMTLTDPTFVKDFFAFADFSKDEIPAPADYDPDAAYEITRFYLVETKPTAFDSLIYYPDQGYVYYNGITNGESEYDGKWYAANPEIERPFREALASRARVDWVSFAVFLVLAVIFAIAYYARPKKKNETNNPLP